MNKTAGMVPSISEVKGNLFRPRGEFYFEKKADGLYLTLYDAHDAHAILSDRFMSHYDFERVGDLAGATTYRITNKQAKLASEDTMNKTAVAEELVRIAKRLSGSNVRVVTFISGIRRYWIDEEGHITSENSMIPSGQWMFLGVSFHNMRNGIDVPFTPQNFRNPSVFENGYAWDKDHGSTRRWGNKMKMVSGPHNMEITEDGQVIYR